MAWVLIFDLEQYHVVRKGSFWNSWSAGALTGSFEGGSSTPAVEGFSPGYQGLPGSIDPQPRFHDRILPAIFTGKHRKTWATFDSPRDFGRIQFCILLSDKLTFIICVLFTLDGTKNTFDFLMPPRRPAAGVRSWDKQPVHGAF